MNNLDNNLNKDLEKIRIQDDLYNYVNKERLEKLVIPGDMPMTGGFATLMTDVEKLMMNEFKEMCEKDSYPNDYVKRACSLYKIAKDIEKKEKDGIEPALKYLSVLKQLNSIDDFNKEALNPNSKLYTQKGTDGCIYYGSDCSGFVSYCMGHKRLTTVGINKAYTHLGKAPISEIKIGDVFNRTSSNRHVILITAIDSEKICTLEQTVPYIKYKETPLSQINTVFYNKKYTVYRNPELIQ